MTERRNLTRWQINKNAGIKPSGSGKDFICQIRDINCTGVQIALNPKLPSGNFFRIQLRLCENCTIEAKVWTSWHKVFNGSNHYGFYFSQISNADKDKINKFISSFYPDSGPSSILWLGKNEDQNRKGGEDVNDYRIFERFRREFSARFIGFDGKEGLAQTIDVSAKGLGLSTNHKLESQAPLEIWLDVPGSTDPVYTRGQVVWSKPEGSKGWHSGIELERADLMGISRLLRARFNR